MSTIAVTNLKHESATGNNIVLDSSGNVAFADGSASAPSITNDGDTNTGIYFPAADNIGFATNGVIRGRWTTDGLCFGSDTAAANALDDYEEGTWTPVPTGWTSVTYNNQIGNYTKIGNQVTAWFYIRFSGTSAASNVTITGLPFSASTAGRGGAMTFYDAPLDSTVGVLAYPTGTSVTLYEDSDAGDIAQSNGNAVGDYLIGSVTYPV